MNYSQKLKDPRWQKKRLEIMKRDDFTCRDTGATDEELQVHHCWYAKGGPWETPSEYLLTLSATAHKHRQGLESRAKKALGLIMAKTPCHIMEEEDLLHLVESMERISVQDAPITPDIVNSIVYSELIHVALGLGEDLGLTISDQTRMELGLPVSDHSNGNGGECEH